MIDDRQKNNNQRKYLIDLEKSKNQNETKKLNKMLKVRKKHDYS